MPHAIVNSHAFQADTNQFINNAIHMLLIHGLSTLHIMCTCTDTHFQRKLEVNSGNKFCIFCEVFYEKIVDHCLDDCSYLDNERSEMWQKILSLSLPAYGYLYMQNISFVSNVLLGMKNRDLEQILGASQEAFKICCIRNIHNMWRKYKMP